MKCADPSLSPVSSQEGRSPTGLPAHLPEEGAGPVPAPGRRPARSGLGGSGAQGLGGHWFGVSGLLRLSSGYSGLAGGLLRDSCSLRGAGDCKVTVSVWLDLGMVIKEKNCVLYFVLCN